ncbi:hypothetical protein N431DRAFT_518986 [Stipitochalara longipes BDJ]|nr:hypothetical protein N431DRAFT_518986 [Stipitochalara longipes BDJ]
MDSKKGDKLRSAQTYGTAHISYHSPALKMHIKLFKVLLSFIAFGQCHAAVTWTTIGCNGFTFDGSTIDQIWDNANLMASNAQSQISLIPSNILTSTFRDGAKTAGANAKLMFGIKFGKSGTDSDGKTTMATVNTNSANYQAVYADIQKGLAKTLTASPPPANAPPNAPPNNFNLNNAYLFCGANGLTHGRFPGLSDMMQDVWYATVTNGGVTEYIVPASFASANYPKPCTETGKNAYSGKTFTAQRFLNGVVTEFVGIILCTNQQEGLKGILTQGFTTTADTATPNKWLSASGTLVHEMAHVVGHARGQTWIDDSYYFDECVNLAQTRPADTLKNPDNFRIFSDMSMSPTTEWKAPNPAPAAPAT